MPRDRTVGDFKDRRWNSKALWTSSPSSHGSVHVRDGRYALGDFTGAVRAFREATRIHPRAAPAFNNLAHVLAEAGKRKEAEAAARSAVALAGPLTHLYRATLATILAEKR